MKPTVEEFKQFVEEQGSPDVALSAISMIISAIFGLARFGILRQVLTLAAVSAASSSERPSKSRCANVGSSDGIVAVPSASALWSSSRDVAGYVDDSMSSMSS